MPTLSGESAVRCATMAGWPWRERRMIFVLLSVMCSVLVSVLLKLARRYAIDVGQAIAWNYVVASALTAWLLSPPLTALRAPGAPWLALVGLGVLLPTIFLALAASVRHAGIVRSDAAQRLSLLLSLLAAFVLFGEQLNALKAVGIALGVLALLGMVWRQRGADDSALRGDVESHEAIGVVARWLYPLLVFVGFGVIDILFKQVALAGVPLGASLQAMFALALVVGFALQLWRRAQGRMRFTARSALGGVVLGLLNFGNILFYLRGHRALPQHPALVFASMNIGVVALGAMVGLWVFRERLSRINFAGLLLAVLALVALAQP
jgi:drug/metabolite transporter (DMT)-like permease